MVEHLEGLKSIPGLGELLEIASLPGEEILARYENKKFFGFTCSYWPEELILGRGMEPFRLFPHETGVMPSELPSFSCSLARGLVTQLKENGPNALKDRLSGIGLVQTCDTMQCLGSICQEIVKDGVWEMVPPVLLGSSQAREYYVAELKALWDRLPDGQDREREGQGLRGGIQLLNRIRYLANSLDEMRPDLPSWLVASLLRAGQIMPREEYSQALAAALEQLPKLREENPTRLKILLTGALLERDDLYLLVEELGGRVVVDDTCTGTRHYAQAQADESLAESLSLEELLDWIASRHLQMPLCPCRHRQLNERITYLEELAGERQVQGAIIVVRKYCEPHAWDAVPIAASLEEKGIGTLTLELEGAQVGGQERTRIQAFLENLI